MSLIKFLAFVSRFLALSLRCLRVLLLLGPDTLEYSFVPSGFKVLLIPLRILEAIEAILSTFLEPLAPIRYEHPSDPYTDAKITSPGSMEQIFPLGTLFVTTGTSVGT